jgi:hypothetical protein
MSIKIDHLKYKVTTKPASKGIEFVELNLVFTVAKDDAFYEIFKRKTEDYAEKRLIADTKLFEEEEASGLLDYMAEHGTSEGFRQTPAQLVKGYEFQNSILRYLPKFDKFQFHEYFGWYGLVQGAINDLRDLQLGINKSRTTDSCLLCHILEALEYHWD